MARRHRSGIPCDVASSSDDDDEEDAFSAMTRKQKKKNKSKNNKNDIPNSKSNVESKKRKSPDGGGDDDEQEEGSNKQEGSKQQQVLPVSATSSTKRHHGVISDSRKQKMDALLLELEAEKQKTKHPSNNSSSQSSFVPDKKGSFVEPGQEHLTTNVFVGNLAPSITEEELTDLFRQFGDLYSVKIMWPRTQEEKSRNRHSGFVCFCNRQDAEDAIAACDETDLFNVGRRVMLRWGKNVKNTNVGNVSIIRQRKKKPAVATVPSSSTAETTAAAAAAAAAATALHPSSAFSDEQKESAIRVQAPKDPRRLHLISTVASFVAKDGAFFEQTLLQREVGNPKFSFLQWNPTDDNDNNNAEHIFYKWRVYSFCQGDGQHTWRTEPFMMVEGGRLWFPPEIDTEAARREEEAERAKEESIQRQKQERRFRNARRDYMTGRQLEQIRKGGPDGGAKLDSVDFEELNRLLRRQLCASREAICEAMAFCFEKSGAAKQISSILEELLAESTVSVETRIARLYLLSDILFNSQQPGVRNAFLYRDAIERMTPKVFENLGKHGDGKLGRMTMNKLVSAVRLVLNAWTDWNVFNPAFLEELFARFEGREIPTQQDKDDANKDANDAANSTVAEDEKATTEAKLQPVREVAQGTWTTVTKEDETETNTEKQVEEKQSVVAAVGDGGDDDDADGEPLGEEEEREDADGEPLDDDEDADGEPLEEEDADGEPIEEDVDGEPL